MSDTQEKLAKLKETAAGQLKDCGVSNIDQGRLDDYCGRLKTMLGNKDALLVSGGDPAELETVRKNFVAKKLGVEDKDKGMAAVNAVADKMKGIHMKSRPAFYYLVAQELGK